MNDTDEKEYVAGFLYDPETRQIALVTKLKPAWQAGRLNGIGGKVEEGETAYAAMVREFKEETGATVTSWRRFCLLHGNKWRVTMYVAKEAGVTVQTMEEEPINWYSLDDLPTLNCIPNLRWLIPLALDKDSVAADVYDPSSP